MFLEENWYYHWHPEKFKKNDIIKVGSYGKLLNTIDILYQQDKYLLKMQFEIFRTAYYLLKPSRFKSIFLFKNCHVLYHKSYYSVPYTLYGKELWLKATANIISIYDQ